MTPVEVAERLEHYAREVIRLQGVSRRNPHAFTEGKSELAGRMRDEAKQLRAPDPEPRTPIVPGTIQVGRRLIPVEVRRKAG